MTTTPPAQPAPVVPATHKLVPIEPSPAMLVALWDHREAMRGHSENKIARAGYAAMLAAAPVPAAPLTLTDEQVTRAAREISARQALICGIDPDDIWKQYGDDFKDEARAILAAAMKEMK